MKTIILFMVLIGSDGSESMQVISKHNSYLSCKAEQSRHKAIKGKITFFCGDSLFYKVNNI